MKIETAGIQHVEDIGALNLSAYSDFAKGLGDEWPHLRRAVSEVGPLLEKLKFFIVADEMGLVGSIGYAKPKTVENRFFPPEWAHIRLLAVRPDARNRGVAGGLIEHVVAQARKDSAPAMGLHTSTLMVSARKLYSRLGFQEDGTSFELFGVRYDRFVLKLQ